MKVCYALSPYISHRRAGMAYRGCLTRGGVTLTPDPAEADLWIWHAEPWAISGYLRAFRKVDKRPVVAVCVWETDRLPESYVSALRHVDHILTPSRYAAAALEQAAKPVHVIPHVVDAPSIEPEAVASMKERIGWEAGSFYFYAIGNHVDRRKGIREVIEAFTGLDATCHAKLVVKTTMPLPPELAAVSGVIEINGLITDAEIAALHAVGDCLVSLHHSEGFGLHIAEAMAVGNAAIATAHGGNVEFMSAENSILVPCSVEHLHEEDANWIPRFTLDMRWGYVDMDAAREALRRAVGNPEMLAEVGRRAAADMKRFSTDALSGPVTEFVRSCIQPDVQTR